MFAGGYFFIFGGDIFNRTPAYRYIVEEKSGAHNILILLRVGLRTVKNIDLIRLKIIKGDDIIMP